MQQTRQKRKAAKEQESRQAHAPIWILVKKFHEFPWRGCFFLCHPHAANTKMI